MVKVVLPGDEIGVSTTVIPDDLFKRSDRKFLRFSIVASVGLNPLTYNISTINEWYFLSDRKSLGFTLLLTVDAFLWHAITRSNNTIIE
jgi:hypothetical protein